MSLVAIALAAFVTQPAPQAPAHAGHAAPAAAARLSTAGTSIGDLMANPASKAVLEKHLPGISSHPQLGAVAKLTLRAVQPMSQGMISAAHLDMIDADLAALPAAK